MTPIVSHLLRSRDKNCANPTTTIKYICYFLQSGTCGDLLNPTQFWPTNYPLALWVIPMEFGEILTMLFWEGHNNVTFPYPPPPPPHHGRCKVFLFFSYNNLGKKRYLNLLLLELEKRNLHTCSYGHWGPPPGPPRGPYTWTSLHSLPHLVKIWPWVLKQ